MFHSIKQKRKPFVSNPALPPLPFITKDVNDLGSPINVVEYHVPDHKSPLSGSHFDPSRHSLRAMLNMGIHLQKVNYGVTDNDLNSLSSKAKKLVSQIEQSVASRSKNSEEAIVES